MATVDDLTQFVWLFHHADHARAAVQALEAADAVSGRVETITNDDTGAGSTLSSLGVPERDLSHLQDGLKHGGVLVSLRAPESASATIERIFHKYSADKIDEADLRANDVAPAVVAPVAAVPVATNVAAGTVIPVAQEQLVVGKREVERGGVRVLRRTVEQPVSEQVNLHEERVALEYRDVNRPATDADLRAGNQEIELVETAEVPVVQKVARVVEEVHVGKVESDRTEVVHDSVRHTEVEVESLDTKTGYTGTRRD